MQRGREAALKRLRDGDGNEKKNKEMKNKKKRSEKKRGKKNIQ
jgi:hypothetical protein